MLLLDLPDCMLEQVFQKLSFDEIAKQRIVCQTFNSICQGLLNSGFRKMMERHTNLHKTIKSQLPRRESERRNHRLANHSDVLTCIETRMSMLSATYSRYMDDNLCCFIPGKVIDEVLRLLNFIFSTDVYPKDSEHRPPIRTLEVLQELRDISLMANNHFEENIAPALKKAYCELPMRSFLSSTSLPYSPDSSPSTSYLYLPGHLYNQLQTADITSKPQKAAVARSADPDFANYICLKRKFKTAVKKMNRVVKIQKRQAKKLQNCSMQITELNAQVIDLRRRLEESNNSKQSLEQIAAVVNTHSSDYNISPRTATIILKRIAESSENEGLSSKKFKP